MSTQHASRRSRSRFVGVVAATMAVATLAAACGGGDANDSPDATVPVKGMKLNECVSVMSGERPAAGVTIPRCVPTTMAANPNRPKGPTTTKKP